MGFKYYRLARKFFSSLKYTGFVSTYKKVDIYIKNAIAKRELNKYAFDCFYQSKHISSGAVSDDMQSDILPIVFYNINQSDISLLSQSKPKYLNHYLPRLPLVYSNNISERIDYHIRLAKEYQIYAFCYEIDNINKYKNYASAIDLCSSKHPFCLSLASNLSSDDINIVFELTDFTEYIKHNDKYIVILDCRKIGYYNSIDDFIDSSYNVISQNIKDFQIWCLMLNSTKINNNKVSKYIYYVDIDSCKPITKKNIKYINKKIRPLLYDYSDIANVFIKYEVKADKPVYKTVVNGRDIIYNLQPSFYKYSLNIFYSWIKRECKYLRDNFKEDERFLFIDSFNNWDEYSHIVPEKQTGYAFLNTMYKAIFNENIYGKKLLNYKQELPQDIYSRPQICIQAHIYYLDLIEDIVNHINSVPYPFDCYISTDTESKRKYIEDYFKKHSHAVKITVEIFENKGRDVYPLIFQLHKHITQYKFICHVHSKKSKIDIYGKNWRKQLYNSLFGNRENVENIIKNLTFNKGLGIVFPKPFKHLIQAMHWGLNKELAGDILTKLNIDIRLPINNIVFPMGNMFWARTDAILPLFTNILFDIFPNERGQVDGTISHAIERLWVYIAEYNGYTYSYCDK